MKLRLALLHWLALALLFAGLGCARAAAPVVSNVRAAQRAGTREWMFITTWPTRTAAR